MFKIILPKFLFKVEKWKWNKEYRVYVSNQGHFKNEYKQNLPIKINAKGYVYVKTRCGYKSAHRLVMLTWAPIPNAESITVDHLDHNKRNNAISNLEWVSKETNLERAQNDLIQVKRKSKKSKPKNKMVDYYLMNNGKRVFSNYLDAAEWLFNNEKSAASTSIEQIAIRLENIITTSTKKQYFGYIWEIKPMGRRESHDRIKRYYC